MLDTPRCFERNCTHFQGVAQPDGTELTEVNICAAYPDGIPGDIAYGDDPHTKVRGDQGNNIVFEPIKGV